VAYAPRVAADPEVCRTELGGTTSAATCCAIGDGILASGAVREPFDPGTSRSHIVTMTIDTAVLADICKRNDIVRLRVFGSFARGDEGARSDLDLIADFSSRKSLLDLVRIQREFSEELGLPVDLLTEGALSPYLRDRILGEARVIYDRAA
jgi:uncharacterized protein